MSKGKQEDGSTMHISTDENATTDSNWDNSFLGLIAFLGAFAGMELEVHYLGIVLLSSCSKGLMNDR